LADFVAVTPALPAGFALRHLEPSDYKRVTAVVDEWWGRPMAGLLPRPFFSDFRDTSFVLEQHGRLVAFLVGFLSQTHDDEAYIHAVGVAPAARGEGLGRLLYQHFFAAVAGHGRRRVRAITSPINADSIAFHRELGFSVRAPSADDDLDEPVQFVLDLASEPAESVTLVDDGPAPADVSAQTRVRRHPERGVYEPAAIYAILDEALYCHVGFVAGGQPFVIPTIHARLDDVLYLHGSPASRMLRELGGAIDVCVTATLLDGIVLARSVYNHSFNYRSAVVLGRGRLVEERDEKLAALTAIVEHVVAGRSRDARGPNEKELAGTTVLAVQIDEASAKVRTGPPKDFDDDLELPIWAGVIPLRIAAGSPETEPRVAPEIAIPAYTTRYRRGGDGDG
jgi:nitroimidazol reductase NimA-like FMN-containing flavoprotein (pyridoxamine 5'-phosphate oxidase superfamily)/ribosomal protein S18 acetylase RimI-like enzyme